jgi:hypothetical protein
MMFWSRSRASVTHDFVVGCFFSCCILVLVVICLFARSNLCQPYACLDDVSLRLLHLLREAAVHVGPASDRVFAMHDDVPACLH